MTEIDINDKFFNLLEFTKENLDFINLIFLQKTESEYIQQVRASFLNSLLQKNKLYGITTQQIIIKFCKRECLNLEELKLLKIYLEFAIKNDFKIKQLFSTVPTLTD